MFAGATLVGGLAAVFVVLFVGARPDRLSAAPPSEASANACDRACLDRFVDRTLDAFAAVDPQRGRALAFFGHAAGKTRTFQLPSGRAGMRCPPKNSWSSR